MAGLLMAQNIGKLLLEGMKQASKSIGIGLQSATLLRDTSGARTAGALTDGPAITTTSYACQAMIEVATSDNVPETLVANATRKIGIFGASLAVVPKVEDRITIEDIDGVSRTFRLVAPVTGDGTAAFFEFAARK